MLKSWPRFPNALRAFLRDEEATTAIEYALIASVVSIAILASALSAGTSLRENFYEKATKAFE
jgi:Flp pilus assembly pilin Flp